MKIKILFTIVFAAILSAGTISLVFLTKKAGSTGGLPEFEQAALESLPEEKPAELSAVPKKEVPQYVTIDTDYFSLVMPLGWEVTSATNTLPIIFTNLEGQIANEKAKEINFQTNLSINRAELKETAFKDYAEMIKKSLISTIPIMEIIKEEDGLVSGKEAHFMEIDSIQQDLRFKTLVVIVSSKDNTVWAFSFNALDESWQNYKDIFYGIMSNNIQMK